MIRLTIYDAAGATDAFLHRTVSDPVDSSASPTRIRSEATILDGPFTGETLVQVATGAFDLATGRGDLTTLRQLVDGERHFAAAFAAPVRIHRFEEDFDAALRTGVAWRGNAFANLLESDRGDDRIHGGGGRDTIRSFRGDDRIDGGSGSDRLFGGYGDDLLVGGAGADSQLGGAGDDVFEFRSVRDSARGARRDVILDFDDGADAIDLTRIDAREDRDGNQAFRFVGDQSFSGRAGELRYVDGIVAADVDGDRVSDLQIELAGAAAFGAGDVLL